MNVSNQVCVQSVDVWNNSTARLTVTIRAVLLPSNRIHSVRSECRHSCVTAVVRLKWILGSLICSESVLVIQVSKSQNTVHLDTCVRICIYFFVP